MPNSATTQTHSSDEAVQTALWILNEVAGAGLVHKVNIQFWDGTLWPDAAPRPTTIHLKHPGAIRGIFKPPIAVSMGEAYLRDDFDVEGNWEDVGELFEALDVASLSWSQKLQAGSKLLRLPGGKASESVKMPMQSGTQLRGKRHSIERAKQAVAFHYNASNDFFKLWLDTRMVYSCAYFRTTQDDLDTAQTSKLDYICRKLRLQPGQRLLDIGCGWGGLVMYAAQHYDVDATGITLSQPQVDEANERITKAGLTERCRVLLRDYREMNAPEPYDALVSVGMFEHVGAALLPTYFQQAWKLLRPQGVFLNHGIAFNATREAPHGPNFVEMYVFPDGETVPIHVTLRAAEESNFEVRDVESLREHYALTLRHWVRRLEAKHEDALKFVDEPTYRIWRLYMSGSAYGFATCRINLYQTLLVKNDERGHNSLPLTREDWYS
ncbi:MAG: class I SAM-dependent methyltransferase [Abitibacteriaceae bacterium]|nr:class I SAM-dependent methyltransferase [Abditibacteriaceae bacterium]